MKRIHRNIRMVLILLVVSLAAPAWAVETFVFASYKDIDDLFEKLDYTQEAWQRGIREIPRVYIQDIPAQWRDKTSKEISVQHKKRIFFRVLGPLIFNANEKIIAERANLEKMIGNNTLSVDEQSSLLELAKKYRVVDDEAVEVSKEEMAELLKRVDIVPPSIALAQGANESGWGTSRFAEAGHSLFGQWTWGGNGIASKGKQEGKGDYKVAAFDTPLSSVQSYMLNINRHNSYAEFREKRAQLRRMTGKNPSGLDLVETLKSYSQKGEAYVQELKNLIEYNKLAAADSAYLSDGEVIEMVPGK